MQYLVPTFLLLAATAAATLIMGIAQGFTLNYVPLLGLFPIVVTTSAIAWFYTHRRNDPRIVALMHSVSFFFLVPATLALMSYVFAAKNLPLVDGMLADADRLMGFDWTAHLALIWSWPTLGHALEGAYHATGITLFLTLIILIVMKRTEQSMELWFLMVATGIVTMVTATFVPAEGAFVFHQPNPALSQEAAALNGIWHLEHFRAVREGTLRHLDVGKIEGIVTFPSYHTAMAIIFAWVLRGTVFVLPAALFSAVVVLSTLAIGGHYLIDVIAGAAVTATVIALSRAGRRRMTEAVPGSEPVEAPASSH
jgi:membrane-associated phospholipid phosphatase